MAQHTNQRDQNLSYIPLTLSGAMRMCVVNFPVLVMFFSMYLSLYLDSRREDWRRGVRGVPLFLRGLPLLPRASRSGGAFIRVPCPLARQWAETPLSCRVGLANLLSPRIPGAASSGLSSAALSHGRSSWQTVIGSRSAPSASRCRALPPQPAALQSLTPRSRGRSRGCGDRGGGTPVPGGGLLDARVGSLIGAGPPSARRSPPPLPAGAGLPSSQGKVRLCARLPPAPRYRHGKLSRSERRPCFAASSRGATQPLRSESFPRRGQGFRQPLPPRLWSRASRGRHGQEPLAVLSGVSVCACGDGELAGWRWPSLPEPLLGRVPVSAAWRGLTAAQCPAGRLSARCGRPAACSWRPCSAEVSGGAAGWSRSRSSWAGWSPSSWPFAFRRGWVWAEFLLFPLYFLYILSPSLFSLLKSSLFLLCLTVSPPPSLIPVFMCIGENLVSLHLAEMGNGESFLPPRLGGGGVHTHLGDPAGAKGPSAWEVGRGQRRTGRVAEKAPRHQGSSGSVN